MDIDDDVRLAQIFGEARVLTAQLLDFLVHRMALGLRPAFPRGQRFADAVGPFAPPIGQQGRVQTFAAEKRADAAGSGGSRLGLGHDALFVLGGVGAPLRFSDHFGIRPRSQWRIGTRFGCRCTALRLATLAFAPFRASQSLKGNTSINTKRISVHLCFFLSRPAH